MSKFNYSTALEKVRSVYSDFDSLPSFQESVPLWIPGVLPETLSAYPKLPKGLSVEELREWDGEGEWGGVLGYYAIGFWEPQSFAIAANKEFFENDGFSIAARVSDVRHVYRHLCPCNDFSDYDDGEPEDLCFCSCSETTPGAIAMTIIEF